MNELYFETCGSPNWMRFKQAVDQDLNQNSLVTKSKEWVFHQSHKRSNKQQDSMKFNDSFPSICHSLLPQTPQPKVGIF